MARSGEAAPAKRSARESRPATSCSERPATPSRREPSSASALHSAVARDLVPGSSGSPLGLEAACVFLFVPSCLVVLRRGLLPQLLRVGRLLGGQRTSRRSASSAQPPEQRAEAIHTERIDRSDCARHGRNENRSDSGHRSCMARTGPGSARPVPRSVLSSPGSHLSLRHKNWPCRGLRSPEAPRLARVARRWVAGPGRNLFCKASNRHRTPSTRLEERSERTRRCQC